MGGAEGAGHTSGLKPGSLHPGNAQPPSGPLGTPRKGHPGASVGMHSLQPVFHWGPLRVLSISVKLQVCRSSRGTPSPSISCRLQAAVPGAP